MSHYHEQFLKQNPLAVLGVLRDLHKAAIPLRLSWNGGQLISKLLAITPDKLVLDFGSQAEDNIAVLKAQHITITAETQGADAPRDKCAHFREINGTAAAFQYLKKNYNPTASSFL